MPDQNFEFTGLLLNNYINSICTAIHGSVVVKAGQYRPHLKFAQDYDYLLRAAALSPPIFINSNLSVYRTHQGQDSAKPLAYLTGLVDSIYAINNCLTTVDPVKALWHSLDMKANIYRTEVLISLLKSPPHYVQLLVQKNTFAYILVRLYEALDEYGKNTLMRILDDHDVQAVIESSSFTSLTVNSSCSWSSLSPCADPFNAAIEACRGMSKNNDFSQAYEYIISITS